jgi:hypothetical protein
LPMGHHPSSAKELIMAQARAQGTLGYAREMHASDSFSALVVNSFLCAFFAPSLRLSALAVKKIRGQLSA